MKVAVIYTSPYPKKKGASGADRRIRDYVRGLRSANVETTMFVPAYHEKTSYGASLEDFPIVYLGKAFGYKIKGWNRVLFWNQVLEKCKNDGYTHLFLYNTTIESVYFAKKAKKLGLKVVVEICDLHSGISNNWSIKEFLAIKNDKLLPQSADLIVTISDFLSKKIESNAPEIPLVKFPIFVDTDLFDSIEIEKKSVVSKEELGLPDDVFLISYVGGLWHHEGVKYLVESFTEVLKFYPNIRLLVAGKYTKSLVHDDVEALVTELGIKNEVYLPGWVDTEYVKKIFSASDLLVVSQTNHDFSKAGLPTKLAEYSASGKAILVTEVGDVPYYFKDSENAVVCKPSSSSSMAEAITRVISDPLLKQKVGENSRKLAESTFDYRVNGERLKKIFIEM